MKPELRIVDDKHIKKLTDILGFFNPGYTINAFPTGVQLTKGPDQSTHSWTDIILYQIPMTLTDGRVSEALDIAEEFLFHYLHDLYDNLIDVVWEEFLDKKGKEFAEYSTPKPPFYIEDKETFEEVESIKTKILMGAFGKTETGETKPIEEDEVDISDHEDTWPDEDEEELITEMKEKKKE